MGKGSRAGRKAAPPLRGSPRGNFCGGPFLPPRRVRPSRQLAAALAGGPLGGHLCPRAPPLAGIPPPGVPRGLRADEQQGPGPGSRRGAGPGCAEPLVGISRTRAGARGRCVSSRVVRLDDSSSPAPRVAFRGATAGLQRPGPHFMPEKPMRRLKALCNSSRKILSRDLYLQKA